jgi:hypothetical protein
MRVRFLDWAAAAHALAGQGAQGPADSGSAPSPAPGGAPRPAATAASDVGVLPGAGGEASPAAGEHVRCSSAVAAQPGMPPELPPDERFATVIASDVLYEVRPEQRCSAVKTWAAQQAVASWQN